MAKKKTDKEQLGRIDMSVSRELHRDLLRLAASEGVSLNTLVVAILAEALGARREYRIGDLAAIADQLGCRLQLEIRPLALGQAMSPDAVARSVEASTD